MGHVSPCCPRFTHWGSNCITTVTGGESSKQVIRLSKCKGRGPALLAVLLSKGDAPENLRTHTTWPGQFHTSAQWKRGTSASQGWKRTKT